MSLLAVSAWSIEGADTIPFGHDGVINETTVNELQYP
jgi:hypothetical protein